MKTNRSLQLLLVRMLFVAILAIVPSVAKGETVFYSDITAGTWANQNWVSDTGTPPPGTTDGSPSTDQVRINKTAGTTVNLTFGASLNLGSLARYRAEAGDDGAAIRFTNGSPGTVLTIGDLFSVEESTLYLRAHQSHLSARFTLQSDRMEIGSSEWNGAAPSGASVGTVYVSGLVGANDYSRVTLTVNTSTSIVGNGRFLWEGSGTGDADIDLGDVRFRDNVYNGTPLTPTFSLGTASSEVDHRVKIRSLQSEAANSSEVSVTGGATVEIYGNTPAEPTNYRFYGEIRDTTRLEKTGANTQILSRSTGNSYSGGTLITAGTLILENTTGSGLGTGAVTIQGSGALGGSGRIALAQDEVITVKTGGMLAPGKEGEIFNTLRIVSPTGSTEPTLSMEAGSLFRFSLGANNASDSIEFLNYTVGALELASGGIGINIEGTVSEGIYQLFVFREGGEGSALVSSGFSEGLYVNSPSNDFTFTLHYNDSGFGGLGVIALEVSVIPEPSSVALLATAIGFCGLWRTCRRRRGVASR